MLKIAHRGSVNGKVKDYRGNSTYHKFPDNSMLSYINAIYEKFDMIECDVSLTKANFKKPIKKVFSISNITPS